MKYLGYVIVAANPGQCNFSGAGYIDFGPGYPERGNGRSPKDLFVEYMLMGDSRLRIEAAYPIDDYIEEDFAGKITGSARRIRPKDFPDGMRWFGGKSLSRKEKYKIKVYDFEDGEEWYGRQVGSFRKELHEWFHLFDYLYEPDYRYESAPRKFDMKAEKKSAEERKRLSRERAMVRSIGDLGLPPSDIEEHIWDYHRSRKHHKYDEESEIQSWFTQNNESPQKLSKYLTALIGTSENANKLCDLILHALEYDDEQIELICYIGSVIGEGYVPEKPDDIFECRYIKIIYGTDFIFEHGKKESIEIFLKDAYPINHGGTER